MAAFSALALGVLLCAGAAMSLPGSAAASKPGQSLSGALPKAVDIARRDWSFAPEVEIVAAKGSKTAKAALSNGKCLIWADGDWAAKPWKKSLREAAGLFVDLHELAHCHEQSTRGYGQRAKALDAAAMSRAREAYADALALLSMDPQGKLSGLSKMRAPGGSDPHDTGFAASCIASLNGSSMGALEKADSCAWQAADPSRSRYAAPGRGSKLS